MSDAPALWGIAVVLIFAILLTAVALPGDEPQRRIRREDDHDITEAIRFRPIRRRTK